MKNRIFLLNSKSSFLILGFVFIFQACKKDGGSFYKNETIAEDITNVANLSNPTMGDDAITPPAPPSTPAEDDNDEVEVTDNGSDEEDDEPIEIPVPGPGVGVCRQIVVYPNVVDQELGEKQVVKCYEGEFSPEENYGYSKQGATRFSSALKVGPELKELESRFFCYKNKDKVYFYAIHNKKNGGPNSWSSVNYNIWTRLNGMSDRILVSDEAKEAKLVNGKNGFSKLYRLRNNFRKNSDGVVIGPIESGNYQVLVKKLSVKKFENRIKKVFFSSGDGKEVQLGDEVDSTFLIGSESVSCSGQGGSDQGSGSTAGSGSGSTAGSGSGSTAGSGSGSTAGSGSGSTAGSGSGSTPVEDPTDVENEDEGDEVEDEDDNSSDDNGVSINPPLVDPEINLSCNKLTLYPNISGNELGDGSEVQCFKGDLDAVKNYDYKQASAFIKSGPTLEKNKIHFFCYQQNGTNEIHFYMVANKKTQGKIPKNEVKDWKKVKWEFITSNNGKMDGVVVSDEPNRKNGNNGELKQKNGKRIRNADYKIYKAKFKYLTKYNTDGGVLGSFNLSKNFKIFARDILKNRNAKKYNIDGISFHSPGNKTVNLKNEKDSTFLLSNKSCEKYKPGLQINLFKEQKEAKFSRHKLYQLLFAARNPLLGPVEGYAGKNFIDYVKDKNVSDKDKGKIIKEKYKSSDLDKIYKDIEKDYEVPGFLRFIIKKDGKLTTREPDADNRYENSINPNRFINLKNTRDKFFEKYPQFVSYETKIMSTSDKSLFDLNNGYAYYLKDGQGLFVEHGNRFLNGKEQFLPKDDVPSLIDFETKNTFLQLREDQTPGCYHVTVIGTGANVTLRGNRIKTFVDNKKLAGKLESGEIKLDKEMRFISQTLGTLDLTPSFNNIDKLAREFAVEKDQSTHFDSVTLACFSSKEDKIPVELSLIEINHSWRNLRGAVQMYLTKVVDIKDINIDDVYNEKVSKFQPMLIGDKADWIKVRNFGKAHSSKRGAHASLELKNYLDRKYPGKWSELAKTIGQANEDYQHMRTSLQIFAKDYQYVCPNTGIKTKYDLVNHQNFVYREQ